MVRKGGINGFGKDLGLDCRDKWRFYLNKACFATLTRVDNLLGKHYFEYEKKTKAAKIQSKKEYRTMKIKRPLYLERLKRRQNNGMVKVITGLRRSGKSFLLNDLFYDWLKKEGTDGNHIIKFAFDSAKDLKKIGEDLISLQKEKRKVSPEKFLKFIETKIKDKKRHYLLLDEIQELGNFESVLNGYLRDDNLDIYVTGSNSKFLSKDVLTEFEGRGDEIHVFPLSFSEFMSARKGDKTEAFDEYMLYGGLPALASMPSDEQKIAYLNTQLTQTYLKDIATRHNLDSDSDMADLLDILASGMATLVNPSKLKDTFKSVKKSTLSDITINNYIQHLLEAYMINVAKRYDVKGKRYINTPYKIYFEDVGLRNARLNFRQHEPSHLMENIIYNELRLRGYNVDVGVVELRTKENSKDIRKMLEIDFVANLGSKRFYIQSSYEIPDRGKMIQEERPFLNTRDSFKKILLVNSSIKPRYDDNGILMMGVKEFLLDPNSLDF